jgi:hypothetical protein
VVNVSHKKTPPSGGVFESKSLRLFDFGFLIRDMLAHDRIILGHFHLVRRGLLVFIGGVEVTGAGSGDQADFIAFR